MPAHYDCLAEDYARHRKAHAGVLARLLACGLNSAPRVLEVGCGTGNYIGAIASEFGGRCWGLDPSLEMLAKAKQRQSKASFVCGEAETLPFTADFLSLIFSVDVIHHVRDRNSHFREAYRSLLPGGLLCIATDSEWVIRNREPMSRYFPETIAVELARYPGVDDLKLLAVRAGFVFLEEEMVERSYLLADAAPYRDKAFSALHLIPEEAFARGLSALEADLRAGQVRCVSRYNLLWWRKE